MHPHSPSCYTNKSKNSGLLGGVSMDINKSKNSGLLGGVSMDIPCIGALVCVSTHGLHMMVIFCVWGEASAWICTVSWSYMHSHVPCGLRPQVPGSCAYGWLWHGCALYKCVSVCQYAWDAYTGPYLHMERGSNMDIYRILFMHGLPHTLLLHKQKQKQWAVGWCEHVCARYRCPRVCQYA